MFRDYTKYEVYADGRIWSYTHNKFLKPSNNNTGNYQHVCLVDNNGKKHTTKLHKIVWIAVNGCEVPVGYEINHIDENKENNHISNLELVTRKENCNFGTRNERIAKARSKKVGAYNAEGELVMIFPSISEAGRQGYHNSAVSECCNCKFNREGNNKYKGYIWKFLNNESEAN